MTIRWRAILIGMISELFCGDMCLGWSQCYLALSRSWFGTLLMEIVRVGFVACWGIRGTRDTHIKSVEFTSNCYNWISPSSSSCLPHLKPHTCTYPKFPTAKIKISKLSITIPIANCFQSYFLSPATIPPPLPSFIVPYWYPDHTQTQIQQPIPQFPQPLFKLLSSQFFIPNFHSALSFSGSTP